MQKQRSQTGALFCEIADGLGFGEYRDIEFGHGCLDGGD